MSAALDRSKGLACSKGAVYNSVLPMSTKGTKPPLWLLHSRVGDVLVFLNLANFVLDRPVYALRAKAPRKVKTSLTIEPRLLKLPVSTCDRVNRKTTVPSPETHLVLCSVSRYLDASKHGASE